MGTLFIARAGIRTHYAIEILGTLSYGFERSQKICASGFATSIQGALNVGFLLQKPPIVALYRLSESEYKMRDEMNDTSILRDAASTVRVTVPSTYANRFAEHFPLYEGDKILPSSGQIASSHHFVIHVARYLPYDTQVAYILNFNKDIGNRPRELSRNK